MKYQTLFAVAAAWIVFSNIVLLAVVAIQYQIIDRQSAEVHQMQSELLQRRVERTRFIEQGVDSLLHGVKP